MRRIGFGKLKVWERDEGVRVRSVKISKNRSVNARAGTARATARVHVNTRGAYARIVKAVRFKQMG